MVSGVGGGVDSETTDTAGIPIQGKGEGGSFPEVVGIGARFCKS